MSPTLAVVSIKVRETNRPTPPSLQLWDSENGADRLEEEGGGVQIMYYIVTLGSEFHGPPNTDSRWHVTAKEKYFESARCIYWSRPQGGPGEGGAILGRAVSERLCVQLFTLMRPCPACVRGHGLGHGLDRGVVARVRVTCARVRNGHNHSTCTEFTLLSCSAASACARVCECVCMRTSGFVCIAKRGIWVRAYGCVWAEI